MGHIFLLLLLLTLFLPAKLLEFSSIESINLKPYYEYTSLKNKDETPQDIENNSWYNHLNELENRGVKSAFWIKFSLKNMNSKSLDLYLLSERSFIYSIECYIMQNKTLLQNYKETYQQRNSAYIFKGVTHRVFPLSIEANQTITVYFKVQSFNKINTIFTLYSPHSLASYITKYNLIEGAFFGIMIIMIIYNLILYFMLHFKPYIYYVLYVSSFILFEFTYLGYLHEYTSLNSLHIYMLLDIFIALFLVLITEFLKEVFEFKKNFPKLSKFIYWIQTYIFIIHLLEIYTLSIDSFKYTEYISKLFYLSLPILYLSVFYALFLTAYRRYNQLAYYYAFLWLFLGSIGLLQSLSNNNILPPDSGFDYLFQFGMLIESVIFSLLLGHRIRQIKQEKERDKRLLIHQNKLASMGEMISLIAHQWRQPLSEINGIILSIDIDHKKERLNRASLEKHLNDIEEVTAYLSKTMDDFIQLSSPKKKLESFTLHEILEQSQKLAKSSITSTFNINIEASLESWESKIIGYKSELIQVFLILFNNAIDACKEHQVEPKIVVRSYLEKESIVLEVEDNGGGVDKNILKDLYNPYFTTKHESQGTGLGLYILKMIIEKSMRGEVAITNGIEGAIFTIKIPLYLS